jgi:hypothetical protein
MLKTLKIILITVLVILAIFGGFLIYSNLQTQFFPNNNSAVKDKEDKINVKIDKTVILEQIKKVNKLETVSQAIQRDFEVQLESEDLDIFGLKILDSSRKQKFAVTGVVSAGIDLSKLTSEDVIMTENQVTITIPKPEIMNINLVEDKIFLLNDESTFLFNLQNLNSNTSKSRTQILQQQLIKQGKQSVLDGACSNKILEMANQNAKESMQELFLLVNQDLQINIQIQDENNCQISF